MHPLVGQFSKLEIFRKLKLSEIEKLLEKNLLIIKKYEKDSLVKARGEILNEVMILIAGKVITEMTELDGKVIQIEDMKAPTILALGATFSKDSILPVDIITTEQSLIAYIQKEIVFDLCMENKEFLKELVMHLGTKFNFISQKLWFITLNNLKSKILFYLNELRKNNEKSIVLDYSIEQLSHLFGVTRPALSRAFSKLEEEGIIKKDGNIIHIIDEDIFINFSSN
ncbi:Crp/Fnr family transcriptional regulator [Marinitoga sp. 38H-ov]|uniref:Crp/Fnr family transcriptional regulator n=1 Tax=Marinitoga sp. 38H-ov TaxID=1755814 RepID=UPI0013EC18E3|nr:Crp/Fnr family transcriptional regulator [Marinitoga sp. 38H-ov]KAF2955409.1 Crp/Fnr family transcriptional regulator [Marinitoga sp. 38H-ov]